MRILIMGGTRFIGVYLTQILLDQGHEVVLFNRGNKAAPEGVRVIKGDRKDPAQLREKLAGESFDVIFDNNGRERSDTEPLAEMFKGKIKHFIYVSSAGVYLPSEELPHREGDAVDPNSRHKGKFETEAYLEAAGLPWTSFRPTYIYGPENYNPVESWFFDRLVRDRPIPMPHGGLYVTQFGHVQDLAQAMAAVIGNDKAIGQIYNLSGDRYVTFKGLAQACAIAAGKDPATLTFINFDPQQLDLGKHKAFPVRVQHFCCEVKKAMEDLNWQPQFDLVSGLKDSFEKDYLASGRAQETLDFDLDDEIIQRVNG